MNSLCRSVGRKSCAREGLLSLQSHYYATAAKTRSPRVHKPTDSTTTTSFTPPPPPPPPIYTSLSPSRGPRPSLSSPPSSSTEVKWARPSEIPFQAKVANSVHLIGYVPMPVQFQTTPDGKAWASTILTTQCPFSDSATFPLVMPIIFEGDLAHIATCHLKENDHVYITGQLSKGVPWLKANQDQSGIRVIVENINFVETSSEKSKISVRYIQEEDVPKENIQEEGTFDDSGRLFFGPFRQCEENWGFCIKSLEDLIDNTKEWLDYRSKKLDRLVKPNFPDFKRKDGSHAIWLDRAPKWVLSKLEGLEFDVQIKNVKITKEGKDELWKNLVENPDNWWDNRLNKIKETHPDFKHKDTGVALWLSSSPAWVLHKLPPPKMKKDLAPGRRETLLS
ncbi:hypothetical protein FNV43_RR03144 [Rhamnella rubrinervis]|uniref:Uncharacterized protein n=1 Tax=Rhamnella rubrinervis TaxID=2594499 RepID=A0A8K0HHU5_9ROSA|nr:hypothetical protein FNV43_RR03144 [Rhamnella rubrinervis]